MTDAPAKIWANLDRGLVGTGRWVTAYDLNVFEQTEYIRNDLVDAKVKSAEARVREECAGIAASFADQTHAADAIADAIRKGGE